MRGGIECAAKRATVQTRLRVGVKVLSCKLCPLFRLTLLSDVLSLKVATGIPRRQGIPFALRATVATAEMVAR